jgi:hypothetical protein
MSTPTSPEGVRTVHRPATPAPAPEAAEATTPVTEPVAATGQSTVDTAIAALAAPPAAAVAAARSDAPPASPRPPQGTVYQSQRAEAAALATGRRRGLGLPALRVGTHTAAPRGLRHFDATVPADAGLLLGVDRDGLPVPLPLFHREPTRVALVGDDWAVRVIVFRALALGARVAVVTGQPQSWQGFGEWATGRPERFAVLPPDHEAAVTATGTEPALLVHDGGPLGSPGWSPRPWQAQLVVLPGLASYGQPALADAQLVLLGRLAAGDAELAGQRLRLGAPEVRRLGQLEPEVVALVGDATPRYVWLRPTEIERAHLGVPRPR